MRSAIFAAIAAAALGSAVALGLALPRANAQQIADVAPVPLDAYGALPGLELVQLSPSGKLLAFVTVSGEQRVLVMLDLATKQQVGGVGVGTAKVRDLEWIGETKILITTTKTETIPQLGLFRAELATGQIYDPGKNKLVSMLANTRGVFPALFSSVGIVPSDTDPLVLVRAYAFENPERVDLFRIEMDTGRARLAEVMGRNVEDFILDPTGKSIARSDYESVSKVWTLLLRDGAGFRENWKTTAPIETPRLIGIGPNGDSVIVAADRPDMARPNSDDEEYYDVNLATGVWRPVRFDFTPESLLFHPVTHRLMGATTVGMNGRVHAFIDPAARSLWESVQGAFSGRSPRLVSWSDDLRKAVVFTNVGLDSGTYFVVNLDAGKLTSAGGAYAAITKDKIGAVRNFSYPATDGLTINGFLTTPPGVADPKGLPLVVLAHGGPASNDTGTFDWWAQALASRGYAVLQSNFRGSTGYGDAFMEAGYGEWGRKMQTDLSDGVRHLAKEGIIDPKRVCIVGASYGGYAALAGPTLDSGVYRCAVSVAGVSDLRLMVESEANKGVSRRENATVRYWNRFMGAEKLGDRSLDDRSPARLAAQADAPILLIHGRDDSVVKIEQSRMMADALRAARKPFEFIELDGEDHWLSRGDTRQRMLKETVRFLQANNPPG